VKLDQPTLLAAALRVFEREGLEGASMRAIAREAGCDASLIYYYFENKEAIFAGLLDQRLPVVAQLVRRLARPSDTRPTAEKLWAVIQIFRTHADDSGFRSMVRTQVVKGTDPLSLLLARKLSPIQTAVRVLIRRGQRQGEIRPDLLPILVLMFLLRMEAEILDLVPAFALRMSGLEPAQALDLAERTWFQVFWRGVSTDPLTPLPFLSPPSATESL
jgi:AcrR family transcriptional regulator